jgi:hypothetical protein
MRRQKLPISVPLLTAVLLVSCIAQRSPNSEPVTVVSANEYHCTRWSGGGSFVATISGTGPFEEGDRMYYEMKACKMSLPLLTCEGPINLSVTPPPGYSAVTTSRTDDGWEVIQNGYITVPQQITYPTDVATRFHGEQMAWDLCITEVFLWSEYEFAKTNVTWKPKGLDTSRGNCTLRNKACLAPGTKNCWQCDDQDRDGLDMDWRHLSYADEVEPGEILKDGRYIYVLPVGPGNTVGGLRVRRYDRDSGGLACSAYYRAFRNAANYRCEEGGICDKYLHVRHSQLNAGWAPLFAAGEMKVWNGQVEVVNNESGHFRPPADLALRACTELDRLNVQSSTSRKCGDYNEYSAELTDAQCAVLLRR